MPSARPPHDEDATAPPSPARDADAACTQSSADPAGGSGRSSASPTPTRELRHDYEGEYRITFFETEGPPTDAAGGLDSLFVLAEAVPEIGPGPQTLSSSDPPPNPSPDAADAIDKTGEPPPASDRPLRAPAPPPAAGSTDPADLDPRREALPPAVRVTPPPAVRRTPGVPAPPASAPPPTLLGLLSLNDLAAWGDLKLLQREADARSRRPRR